MHRPVLVTGSHRSGTTWVGSTLARAPGLTYVGEPFNPILAHNPYVLEPKPFVDWFTFVGEANEDAFKPYLDRALGLRRDIPGELGRMGSLATARRGLAGFFRYYGAMMRGDQFLMKDPIALFSAGWLARTYDLRVVVMVRHPAAFVSSLIRQDWRFDFANLTRQPLLMEWLPEDCRERVADAAGRDFSFAEEGAVLWLVLHGVIRRYEQEHPDWLFVRHEDIAREPERGFGKLFGDLGLPFTGDVRDFIRESTGPDNPVEARETLDVRRNSRAVVTHWKASLDAGDEAVVRGIVEPLSSVYYSDADWEGGAQANR